MLASAKDLLSDSRVMATVGSLHFSRFTAGPDDWAELQLACLFFAPLLDRRPAAIPELVRAFLMEERKEKRASEDNPAKAALVMALAAKPPATVAWIELLWQLSLVLHEISEESGEDAMVREALAVARHALQATPADDQRRSRRLSGLGSMLQARFGRTRDPSVLDEAIKVHRQAAADVTHPDHAAFLFNLGSSLIYRYQQTGQAADLRESLDADRQAVAKTPPSHPAYPRRLANLGICLLAWYREQGRAEVLGEALATLRSALASTNDVRIRQAFILPALGTALRLLYETTGDLDALNAAIDAHAATGAGDPPEPAQSARQAVNLAGVLLLKYKRAGEVRFLEAAIDSLRDARDHSSGDSPAVLTALHSSLSTALQERYDRTREQADLDEAISHGRQAVLESVTPATRRATRNTLAGALLKRFLRDRNGGPFGHQENVFLEEALSQLRQAAGIASADDPELAATLANLGNALLLASEANMATAAEASEVFGKAAESQLAPPQIRAEANVAGGRLAAKRGDWDLAVRRLAAAIGLLEQAVPRTLRRADREHQLKRLRDLASDAAACAWRNGDTKQAVVLFEHGRGVLLAQAMNNSADLEKLDAERPDLRIRFDRLRHAIDASGSYGFAPIAEVTDWTRLTTAEHRRELIGQWNALTSRSAACPDSKGSCCRRGRPTSWPQLTKA